MRAESLLKVRRNIFSCSFGQVFLCCVAASLFVIGAALDWWGAKEIRGDTGEIFFLTLCGAFCLLLCIYLFKWLGISLRDDVVDRGNEGALIALCSGTMATALIYVGGSAGEGPSYLNNVFSVGLALAGLFFLWILMEAAGGISMSIAEERDLASGIRFGGFLLALGLVFGRAVAGDWHSVSATVHDFFHYGWFAVVICAVALVLERFARPNRQRPFPSWQMFGLFPALLYLAIAGGWLRHIGPWEGMPK